MLHRFDALDRRLVAAGFPATSPWWRETLERLYQSSVRQAVLRVGRRGGKSSTLCRVAVLEALYGLHVVPPGDLGIVGIVSVSRDEANQRLRTIKAILDALGVTYKPIDGGIELADRPVAFKVFTASIAGVVGGTWICAICDEAARWRDNDTGANPAREVLASLRPTLATMPHARIFLSSSPLGTLDAHAAAFAAGDSAFQRVAHAESWVANPTLTEAATRELEPDERVWSREYAAQPQAGAISAFASVDVDRAIQRVDELQILGRPIVVLDSSAGSGDSWTWAAVAWCQRRIEDESDLFVWDPINDSDPLEGGAIQWRNGVPCRMRVDAHGRPTPGPAALRGPVLTVYRMGALEGRFAAHVAAGDAVAITAQAARGAGADRIVGDKYQSYFLGAQFSKLRLTYTPLDWTSDTKTRAVATLRRWLRDGSLAVEAGDEAEKLRAELLRFEERIAPSGILTYGARRGGHDDRVALLLNAAMADSEGLLEGSPGRTPNFRHEIHDHTERDTA